MPTFEITTPDGRTFQIEGANKEGAVNALRQYLGDVSPEPEPESIDRSGVEDYGLRMNLARAENADEYRLRLEDAGFDESMYFQEPRTGNFVLRLDDVPDNLKKQYGLKGTGNLQIEDDKIFTKQDIAEFFSANSGPIVGGTLGAIAATGVGILPAMLLAGGGSAAGYLLEEGVEYAGGVQNQDLASVGRSAAFEAAAGALGEGAGRAVTAVAGRIIKGPGGDAANQTRELGRAALEANIRPTVMAATRSPLVGRMQAIYEGLLPNRKAAKQNAEAIIEQIKKLRKELRIEKPVDYNVIRDALNRDINRIYGTPEDLIKQANSDLEGLVSRELQKVKSFFGEPDPRGSEAVAEAFQIAKQTFDEDVAALYDQADLLLGRAPIIETKGIKNTLSNIIRDNPALNLENTAFGKFVMDMDDKVTVQTANSLRTVLNHASFDPSLVGAADRATLTRLNNAVQNAFLNTEAAVALSLKENVPLPSADGRFATTAGLETARKGLETLRKAQAFYSKGIDRFQDVAAAKLFQQYRTGKGFNPEALTDPDSSPLLRPNNGPLLRTFLNAATPFGRTAERSAARGRVSTVPQTVADVVPNTNVTLQDGQRRNLKEVIGNLDPDDSLRRYYEEIFTNQKIFAEKVTAARESGVGVREAVRKQLAGDYLAKVFDQRRNLQGFVDAAKVAEEIYKLGSTGKVLFGKQYSDVIQSLKDVSALGRNITDEDLARFAGQPITDQMLYLRSLTKAQDKLKGTPLLRKLERAAAEGDPEAILREVFRKDGVAAIKAAEEVLGRSSETMEAVRELGLRKIVSSAGDPNMMSGDDFVQAVLDGKHAKTLETTLNAYGRETLETLFGKDTTDGLYALSKISYMGSLAPIKGLGGLAPASMASTLGIIGAITAPLTTAATIVGLNFIVRLLRSKAFLKIITKPTGVRPGKGVSYDEIGRAFEQAYEIAGQVGAGMASETRRQAEIRMPAVLPPQVPQAAAPTAPAPTPAPAPTRMAMSPELLGSDPITQMRNLEIFQRQQR